MSEKVEKWITEIELLSKIGYNDPHSAYIAYTRCFKHKFGYIMRTIPDIQSLLKPLDTVIDKKFIPSLTNGQVLTENERLLFALPVSKGGMGISVPSKLCDEQYNDSREITASLTRDIIEQNENYKPDKTQQKRIKNEIRAKKAERYQNELERLLPELNYKQVRILDCVREKVSSNWLTALPIKEKGFHLSKDGFWDSICLRYGLYFK